MLDMKRALLFVFAIYATAATAFAKKDPPPGGNPEKEEIHWISSIDELQRKMQQAPKKVIIDVYTSWCGWCKKMDADTYTNPSLIKYVNNNYYAVKFDAETRDTIHFQGKDFYFAPQYKTNGFILEMMKGQQLSYPQTIFMLENFQSPTPIPGYRTVKEMETFLTYFGDNVFRRQPFDKYSQGFTSHWSNGNEKAPTPPPGH